MNKLKIWISGIVGVIFILILGLGITAIVLVHTGWGIAIIALATWFIDMIFGIYIINSHREQYSKTCWILTILVLPFIGVVIFLIFGTNPLTKIEWHDFVKKNKELSKYEDYSYTKEVISNQSLPKEFIYGYTSLLSPIYNDTDIKIIKYNEEFYDSTIQLIRSAKSFIHIQMFMIRSGVFFKTFCSELIKKAKEGIEIRLLFDWYGSFHKYKRKQLKEMKAVGIQIGIFNPPGINMFKGATNYRSHHKMIIVDNKSALCGGSNIADDYLSISKNKYYWRDLNFLISGSIINSMNINFITNWILFSEYTVDKSDKMLFANQTNKYLTINKNNRNDSLAQYVYSSPCLQTKDIHNEIINLITNAKHSIKITTPYFLITSELITTILIARRKNIPIEIIVPGRRDNKDFIIPMNRSHYKKMLDMGVSIYEYDGFIHSKLLIVDDYCLITSSNFDYRSFFSTFEGGVLVHSKNILKELTSIFEDDKQNSKNITKEFIKTYDSLWFKIQCLAVNIIKPLF